jgi:hypothetical protein
MFGLSLTTKVERQFTMAVIQDLREEIERLRKQIERERKRAEGAINLLLLRTTKAAISVDDHPTEAEMEKLSERQFDLFGDGHEIDETKALEELQS